jgi:FkbM family methyltransferase
VRPAAAEDSRADRNIGAKRFLAGIVPPRWRLPLRYRYQSVAGKLEAEMSELPLLVEREGRALDIGANHGIYSYALSRLARRVDAFEPQPWCAETLAAWRGPNVTVHVEALSDVDGELQLAVPVLGGHMYTGYAHIGAAGDGERGETVPVRRLDSFGFDDVTFAKIDVEGHEGAVIAGARDTLARCRPTLLVEIEQRHLDGRRAEDRIAEIAAYGYDAFFRLGGTWHPAAGFSYARHQEPFLDVPGAPGFVNNFVFLPTGGCTRVTDGRIGRDVSR